MLLTCLFARRRQSTEGKFRLFVQNQSQGKTRASTIPKGYSNGRTVTFTGFSKKAANNMP